MELHSSCAGDWGTLVTEGCLSQEDCDAFLDYSATFLSNIGNYYVRHSLSKLTDISVTSHRAPVIKSLYPHSLLLL
jgi:hypothetical protein